MKTGILASTRTVGSQADVSTHAMATETVMPIAVINFGIANVNVLVR